jgi:hypothetical protein
MLFGDGGGVNIFGIELTIILMKEICRLISDIKLMKMLAVLKIY